MQIFRQILYWEEEPQLRPPPPPFLFLTTLVNLTPLTHTVATPPLNPTTAKPIKRGQTHGQAQTYTGMYFKLVLQNH